MARWCSGAELNAYHQGIIEEAAKAREGTE